DEQRAPAEQVGGASAEQQEAAEEQRVGVHHPGERRVGEAEVGLDGGQRDVHDRRVEHDHELAEADDDQREPGIEVRVIAPFHGRDCSRSGVRASLKRSSDSGEPHASTATATVTERREPRTPAAVARGTPSVPPSARIRPVPGTAEIELSAAQARRAALAAQGLTVARPRGRVDVRHIRRALDALGIVQLDSVNVFSRSHYMPLFSRLGPYPRETLDLLSVHQDGIDGRTGSDRRELFEYWGHEASLIPVDMQPLLRWRMARADKLAWAGVARVGREERALVKRVLKLVRERGPIRAS